MRVSFDNAFWLLLIPIFIGVIIFTAFKMKGYSKIKRNFFTVIRSIVCILLILALSGIRFSKVTDTVTTIFAVDLSASSREAAEKSKDFFDQSKKYTDDNMRYGAVVFGSNSVVEKKPDENIFDWSFKGYVSDSSTNIEEGLKLSSTLFDDNTAKRIVLVSDGVENTGDVVKEAGILKSKNITVDAYIPKVNMGDEVQITSLNVDRYINRNVSYQVGVTIDSTINTNSVLKLYKDNNLVYNENIVINKGTNNIAVNDISTEGGFVIYRAVIEPEIDTYSENNQIYESCYIEDVPSVLVIDENDSGREIKKILEASKLNVVSSDGKSAPSTIEQLEKYDAVVISDVNIDNLSQEFLQSLDLYVKNMGGGLLVTSGENSLALGGYFGTQLETMLPVDMQLKTEGENPDIGMVFVIDHSGSMSDANYGISRMEMAKEAIIRSIDTLRAEDTVGVLSFDDFPEWVWEPTVLGENGTAIKNEVAKMQPDGGTSILPALNEAYEKLSVTNAKIKHIILLTDGQAETTGYDSVIKSMNNEGITLSTVAVGSGADTKLLKSLAEKSNGRYYFTNEFTDLPKIFANETFLAGKDYINNRNFYPSAGSYSEITENISEVPQVGGYISSTLKSGADMVLETDKEEPLLATWQYGIGRSAVWTSDVNGKWTSDWLSSDTGNTILRNTVSWIMKKQISDEVKATAEINGSESIITLEIPKNNNINNISGKIVSFDNKEYDVNFEAVLAGVFTGKIPETTEGAYVMNIQVTDKEGKTENINTAFNIHYPLEYDITRVSQGDNIINKIVETTGGKIISSPSDVYSANESVVYDTVKIDKILIVLALIVFLFDVFARRFYFVSDKVEKIIVGIFNGRKEVKVSENKNVKTKVVKQEITKETENTVKSSQTNSTAAKLLKNKKKREK